MKPLRAKLSVTLLAAVVFPVCFGARSSDNRYFVLHLPPPATQPDGEISGIVRVRNLDAESAYDKFQVVIRQNPYELNYQRGDVWAVKPNRMISDLIARRLQEFGLFSAVLRDLGTQRPEYTLGGDLHAVEIYDSGDTRYVHLAITLSLSDFRTGDVMWTYYSDERREVGSQNFAHAIRTLSELLEETTTEAFLSMAELAEPSPRPEPVADDAAQRNSEATAPLEDMNARRSADTDSKEDPVIQQKPTRDGQSDAIFVPEAAKRDDP